MSEVVPSWPRVLLRRDWLLALLASVVFAVAAWFLGQWQWHRYEARHERAQLVQAHYDAPPVPVTEVVGDAPLDPSREWTSVMATGRYDTARTIFVRNRPLEGTYGYEVLVPLRTADGVVLVDRGWVPNSDEGAAVLPDVPEPPPGEVTVTGWLRRAESEPSEPLPRPQLGTIDLDAAAHLAGGPVLGGYVVLDEERAGGVPTPPERRPARLDEPTTGTGPHLFYAFQWWAAMPIGFVLVALGVRRQVADARWRAEGHEGPRERPRKVRIWDEEDA